MIQPITKPASVPLYVELADSLQQLVEQGTLRPGHRVPSVRRMALQRDVSISTVLQAYTVLENRGFLEARPQSGYYVRPRLSLEAPEPRMARPMAKPSYVGVSDLTAEFSHIPSTRLFFRSARPALPPVCFPRKSSPGSWVRSRGMIRH